MATQDWSRFALCVGLIPALTLAGCRGDDGNQDAGTEIGIESGPSTTGETSASTAGDGDGDGETDGPSLDMPSETAIVDLKIDPPNAIIEIVDGVIPAEFDFAAIATNDKGDENMVDTSGIWTFDRLDIASLDPAQGALTATGLLGGLGTLAFSYAGLDAQANVTVKLRYTINPDPVDPATATALDNANQHSAGRVGARAVHRKARRGHLRRLPQRLARRQHDRRLARRRPEPVGNL